MLAPTLRMWIRRFNDVNSRITKYLVSGDRLKTEHHPLTWVIALGWTCLDIICFPFKLFATKFRTFFIGMGWTLFGLFVIIGIVGVSYGVVKLIDAGTKINNTATPEYIRSTMEKLPFKSCFKSRIQIKTNHGSLKVWQVDEVYRICRDRINQGRDEEAKAEYQKLVQEAINEKEKE